LWVVKGGLVVRCGRGDGKVVKGCAQPSQRKEEKAGRSFLGGGRGNAGGSVLHGVSNKKKEIFGGMVKKKKEKKSKSTPRCIGPLGGELL